VKLGTWRNVAEASAASLYLAALITVILRVSPSAGVDLANLAFLIPGILTGMVWAIGWRKATDDPTSEWRGGARDTLLLGLFVGAALVIVGPAGMRSDADFSIMAIAFVTGQYAAYFAARLALSHG
jgi:hypothetical protein